MEQHGYDFEKLWHNIQQVIIKTMLAGHAALNHNYRLFFPRTADANCCFQILGFDIMLDEDLDPWVIEVNRSPSLATDTVRLPQMLLTALQFLFMGKAILF
jgi:tubulin polyglutamylase TTLL6/13